MTEKAKRGGVLSIPGFGYKVENGYTNYNYNFVWGNVNYTVTLMYEGNLIDSQEFRDGQPDCISIKVAQE